MQPLVILPTSSCSLQRSIVDLCQVAHDLPFSGANAIRDCVSVLSILAKEMAVFCARIPKKDPKTVF